MEIVGRIVFGNDVGGFIDILEIFFSYFLLLINCTKLLLLLHRQFWDFWFTIASFVFFFSFTSEEVVTHSSE